VAAAVIKLRLGKFNEEVPPAENGSAGGIPLYKAKGRNNEKLRTKNRHQQT
jgi:hypothetical protein